MLKIFILLLSFTAWTKEEHATISLQRWNKKLVVTINHEEGWHTYWKNPGDAGIPESFKFFQNNTPLKIKEYEWPAPKRYIEAGDIMTIGYSGIKHFYFDDVQGEVSAQVGVLICKDICIPEEAKLTLKNSQNFVSSRTISSYSSSELEEHFNALPKEASVPKNFEFYITRKPNENLLTIHYSFKDQQNLKLPHQLPLLTPFPQVPWGFKRETLYVKDQTFFGKTEVEWDGEYQEPPVELPKNGQFTQNYKLKFLLNVPGEKEPRVIEIGPKNFSLASQTLDNFYQDLTKYNDNPSVNSKKQSVNFSNFLKYLFFAFLGGFILNLMPCVLPVISLKLFGLIKHQNLPQKKIFFHNLSYSAGVLSSFMLLALVIAGLKATGEEIGWGFQLQSPSFVLIMMLILFVLALNLFGLFEFKTPGGSKLGNVQTEEGFTGDFFSGVLTTILSTPCSAPFLGTALTFAFTSSYYHIFILFFFIGLGLCFPFLLTALFPGSLRVLPKPGLWMEKLKYFLGLSLVATVVWLYDVFVSLVDFPKVSWKLNLLFVFWFFAFFFLKKISSKKSLQFSIFLFPIFLTFMALRNLPMKPTSMELSSSQSKDDWSAWSEEAMEEKKGKLVFMDFTAEWCLTCKVNKKLVLETDGFKELSKKYSLQLLRGDWTKRDDRITQFLLKNNTVGVPAYFIQKPDGSIIALGETISIQKIENHLR